MRVHKGMRPQDVVVLLKVLLQANSSWRYTDLAAQLGLSQSEVSESLERSRIAGLIEPKKRRVFVSAFLEFLIHGLRYVFPAEPGPVVRGLPTAHSASPLLEKIVSKEVFVWPDERGQHSGQAIQPLYAGVASAARQDARLYELLALVDAVRVGRSREKLLAQKEIEARLKALANAAK